MSEAIKALLKRQIELLEEIRDRLDAQGEYRMEMARLRAQKEARLRRKEARLQNTATGEAGSLAEGETWPSPSRVEASKGAPKNSVSTRSPRTSATSSVTKEPDPRHAPMVKALCDAFKQVRGAKYLFTPRDARALSCLLKVESSDSEILARWDTALFAAYPTTNTIADLERNWNAYAPTPDKPKNDFTGWTRVADRKKSEP